jgi:HK97 family phage major capsid protein
MPNSAQLAVRGKEMAKRVEDLKADETMTWAEKATAMDVIEKEWEQHQAEVNTCERGAELMRKGLGDFADGATGEDGERLPVMQIANLKRQRARVAETFLRSEAYKNTIRDLGGPATQLAGPKRGFTHEWELSLKDSTQATNTMGEGFFGTPNSFTGISDGTYFLPGAYGPGIQPQFLPGVVEQRLYELTIADLFPSVPTTSPVLTYLSESVINWNSAATAEGGVFPFSSNEFARHVEEIGKITNAAEVTDELIKDAPFLWNFLQTRLVEGVQRQEEVQILAGSGYPGVKGLLSRASSFTQGQSGLTAGSSIAFPASSTPGAGVASSTITSLPYGRQALGTGATGTPPTPLAVAEAIFASFVDIQTSIFYSPNAIVCNPHDWMTLRLAKDNNLQYYGGSMFGADYGYSANEGNGYLGQPGNKLWNTRVVQTPVMPKGIILVGFFDMSTGFVARREGLSMQMSNQAGTNFTDGQVTIRAEERLGLAITRPAAFELIEISNAP